VNKKWQKKQHIKKEKQPAEAQAGYTRLGEGSE